MPTPLPGPKRWIHVQCTSEDIARLNELARITGWTKSDCVRNLLRAAKATGPQLQFERGTVEKHV